MPIVVGGVLFLVLACWLMVAMTERPSSGHRVRSASLWKGKWRRPCATACTTWGHASAECQCHPTQTPRALTILAIAGVWGGFTEGLDRLGEAHFIQVIGLPRIGNLDTVVWFGIIAAGGMLLTIGASELARRRLALEQPSVAVKALLGSTLC